MIANLKYFLNDNKKVHKEHIDFLYFACSKHYVIILYNIPRLDAGRKIYLFGYNITDNAITPSIILNQYFIDLKKKLFR